MIALSLIIALPLFLLCGQKTWIWYVGCQHPKAIKCTPKSLSDSSSPTISAYLGMFRFYDSSLFPALQPVHILLMPVFLLPRRPDLGGHCHFRPWYESHVVIALPSPVCFLAETVNELQYFASNFPHIPSSLYLDGWAQAITTLPSSSRCRATCPGTWTCLRVLSESSIASSPVQLLFCSVPWLVFSPLW